MPLLPGPVLSLCAGGPGRKSSDRPPRAPHQWPRPRRRAGAPAATLCAGQPPPGCARRPHDRFRQDRATHRNSGKPTPGPPPPGLPGDDGGQHRESTGTGGRPRQHQRTRTRAAGRPRTGKRSNGTEKQADPGGSRSSGNARRAARPRTGARQRRAEAGRPRIYGNRSNGSPQTLPVFFFFWRGLRKPVALVASPLCVLAGRNGESDHASPREKRAGTESANGSPLPVSAASRRPVEKVPGFNAGGREPVSELRVLGSRWLYLLLWPPRRKSLA